MSAFMLMLHARTMAAMEETAVVELPVVSDISQLPSESMIGRLWRYIRRVVLPEPLALMYELRGFITDLPRPDVRTREHDLQRLDAMYEEAIRLSEGDIMSALLMLTWATLPYHTFPAVLPILNLKITVPVSTESRASFDRRLANLPGVLLKDTPSYLDRDKLPHFFGSAWLQCVLKSPELADACGEMIERLEEVFKLEGSRDPRDIMVNRLGISFAMQLQRQRAVRPSEMFLLDTQHHDIEHHPHR
jgi:hypothetical protein